MNFLCEVKNPWVFGDVATLLLNMLMYTVTSAHKHALLPHHTEPTLTIANLSNAIEGVQRMDNFAVYLNVPSSTWDKIKRNISKTNHCQELASYYIHENPCPSWLEVANALWIAEEYRLLEDVGKHYLKGKTCIKP